MKNVWTFFCGIRWWLISEVKTLLKMCCKHLFSPYSQAGCNLYQLKNEIFVIDSQNITLKLTKHKQNKIFTFGEQIVKSEGHPVRKTANFLGNKVLCFEAVILEPLHYGNIETWKISAFKVEKGNSESKISISIIVKTGGMVERQLFTNYRNPEEIPTNTPRGFHVKTTWKWSFARCFKVEYTWCVCRDSWYYLYIYWLLWEGSYI